MKIELIAEISTNHGGDLWLASEFIQRFADAGATWIKFQHTRVAHLSPEDPQYAWLKEIELRTEDFALLKRTCEKAGVKFLTTVFHPDDVEDVLSLGVDAIKIGSGEHGHQALLNAVRATDLRILQSVHLINDRAAWRQVCHFKHELLTCVTRYPASRLASLEAIKHIGYNRVVGYSDHSEGLEMAQFAMDCGARIVEKHVQLPNQARPPRAFEATVEEFTQLRKYADEDPGRFRGRWQHA